ncbi:hypothetical protein CHS0354_003132 [Potamilus streckersoni]|uniref:C-Jun-amino-terminal kinase-interacting protein 4 n=1 Tax=Potamilus streckersoni TaxID=2493646 RepID=A0AAE0VHM5_9BIVA|nr:hypothetical protein CHS0354_003132 [Potamilus streckersoni]
MAASMEEIVYGTKEDGHVMTEKVQTLATAIYAEFERMIKKYDEDVVKELMPLIVGILENLDQAYTEKSETEVDQELLREDNEQLLTQYEREKQLRKAAEQKYLELEDMVEEARNESESKVESLESIVRMLELKSKNSSDHVSRLEEKEADMKKEYNKLHERYTELMRTHMDYMERAKILMGTDRITEMSNSPRSRGLFHLPNLKPVNLIDRQNSTPLKSADSPPDASAFDMISPRSGKDSTISIRSELGDLESPERYENVDNNRNIEDRRKIVTSDKEQNTDKIEIRESATATKKATEKVQPHASVPASTSQFDHDRGDTHGTETKSDYKSSDRLEKTVSEKEIIHKRITSSPQEQTLDRGSEKVRSRLSEQVSQSDMSVIKKDRSMDKKHLENRVESADSTTVLPNTVVSPILPVRGPQHIRFSSAEDAFEEDHIPGLDNALAHIVATTPELDMEQSADSGTQSGTNSYKKLRNDTSIFDELTIQDADIINDVDYGADITGKSVNPADYASSDSEEEQERNSNVSDNFFGMGKELENLILENTELLATKNALNIVKDDLIARVDELTSEQEILREEINSIQVVRSKLSQRVKELEEEVKRLKDELEKKSQSAKEQEDEDDVPMAQRKRFTRVEMARVLMERNQYKERLMELQEAVRWTEMIRASREHPDLSHAKKKSSIWNFFSNLFSSAPNKPNKKPLPLATVKYNAPTTQVQPVGDPNRKSRTKYNLGDKAKAYDFLQDDLSQALEEPILSQPDTSEKAKKERERERKEQYKQVRAHVKKDDGRMQAYGWSLPAKFQPQIPNAAPFKSSVPVPVPVYCRPLLDKGEGLKIWCAAGVNLTGGKTRDGGSIVGASVFYSNPPEIKGEIKDKSKNDVEKLDDELKTHEENLKQAEKEQLSSFVWICTSTHTKSKATVIDANNPGDILDSFHVSTAPILCIASVPGALESDYPVDEDILKTEFYPQYPATSEAAESAEEGPTGGITYVQCATGANNQESANEYPLDSTPKFRDYSPDRDSANASAAGEALKSQEDLSSGSSEDLQRRRESDISFYSCLESRRFSDTFFEAKRASGISVDSADKVDRIQLTVFKAKGSPATSGRTTPTSVPSGSDRRIYQEPSELVKDGISCILTGNDLLTEEVEKMSSVAPTMWLGAQSGSLYVHSSVTQWRRCLHSVKLRDSILSIVHVKGRVLVALADGTVAIFHRTPDGQWDLQNYHLLDLGRPHHSIRCMAVVANQHVWCGYRNKIHVVDPKSMTVVKSFDAHPRKESQVRQLSWVGDGVWVSIRLDSTLRLYHAYTHQHLQDVDIEPYVSKMLGTGKLGFSFVRITAMLISCNRLWIGTGNGVIISVPLSESNKQAVSIGGIGGRPGGIVRVYSDSRTDNVTPSSFIPYCTMAQAQLSFHGHRDAVKFFVAVPGKKRQSFGNAFKEESEKNERSPLQEATPVSSPTGTKLVLSGGEGYVDFRIGDSDDEIAVEDDEKKAQSISKGERSHLIVWEVSTQD